MIELSRRELIIPLSYLTISKVVAPLSSAATISISNDNPSTFSEVIL